MLKKLTTLTLITAIAVSMISCNNGKTAVNIDGDKISLEQFLDYYYAQNSLMLNMTKKQIQDIPEMVKANHQTLNKDRFMEFIISRKLILNKALQDKEVDQKELEAIAELMKLNAVATYYLTKKLKNDVTVSQQEIEAIYKQYAKNYRGVPINQAEADIKQKLTMQKFEQESQKFIQKLIAGSKVERDGFDEYLKSLTKKTDTEKKEETNTTPATNVTPTAETKAK